MRMRSLHGWWIVCSWLALAGAIGCGGSASAGAKYCQQYAQSICHKAYICTPAAMQDAAFHDSWGPSEAMCTSGFSQFCAQSCPAVDQTAEAQCFSLVNSSSCGAFNDETYASTCAQVCVDAPTGTGGAAGGSGGGAGGSAAITDPLVFCRGSHDTICDRAFQCIPVASRDADFISSYGASVTACKAMTSTICVDPATNCPTYSPTLGGACISALTNDACVDLVFLNGIFPPASCVGTCGT